MFYPERQNGFFLPVPFYFQKAYDMINKFFGEQHPSTITVKEWLDDC
jgi:hypothetical protein